MINLSLLCMFYVFCLHVEAEVVDVERERERERENEGAFHAVSFTDLLDVFDNVMDQIEVCCVYIKYVTLMLMTPVFWGILCQFCF